MHIAQIGTRQHVVLKLTSYTKGYSVGTIFFRCGSLKFMFANWCTQISEALWGFKGLYFFFFEIWYHIF
jgi:hypothetical protein